MFSSSIKRCRASESTFLASKILVLRNFASKSRNLYETLGITPHATQADIKTAYYKLSKQYHPDLNPNDKAASDRFRAVADAYEVLGNYRLRKLYDKGVIHTAGHEYAQHAKPTERTKAYDMENEVNDDPSTKFYKSRLRREHTGKSKIYDFDEWTRNHYGDTFNKQQQQKARYEAKIRRDERHKSSKIHQNVVMSSLIVLGMLVIIAEYLTKHRNFDIDQLHKSKGKEK